MKMTKKKTFCLPVSPFLDLRPSKNSIKIPSRTWSVNRDGVTWGPASSPKKKNPIVNG